MQPKMYLPLLLLLPFVAGACTVESTSELQLTEDADTGDSVAPAGFADGDEGDGLTDALGQDPSRQPLIPAPSDQGPYEPKRAPQFHFESDAISDAQLGEFYIEMTVSVAGEEKGTMTFELWPDKAPKTVRNFLRYCDEGYYDGLAFHRILRDFMLQGGSSTNTGAGQGPHGNIPAEFSDDAKFDHRYGVLSMARSQSPDSASSQFFVICGESMSTVGLNGKYASFGMMVHGVAALEAAASVPTGFSPMNPSEKSAPQQRVLMTKVEIKRGQPTVSETIAQPLPDLQGEPAKVVVQHVLISMAGTPVSGVTRTKEEAQTLANEVLERAKNGDDFAAMVLEYTDDPSSKKTVPPGRYRMLNSGITDYASMKGTIAIMQEAQEMQSELMLLVNKGELTPQDARTQLEESGLIERLQAVQWMAREEMIPAFGDVAFALEVGEVRMLSYDVEKSPFGWHIIKRSN